MSGLARLNGLDAESAAAELVALGGSREWARRMAAARPFRNAAHAVASAGIAWEGLDRDDWLEAFRAHPRIGDRRASGREAEEQAGARGASEAVRSGLERGNRAYEERFGHVFLVCASGKSGEEMLEMLERRLRHDPETELRIAAEEQRKITALRLERAFGG